MYLVVAREPYPDKAYWPGRRWLGALDAVAWPALLVVAISRADESIGVVGPAIITLAVLFALHRLHRALWLNHRYRFTTWRWGKVTAALLLAGYTLKLLMAS